MIMGLPGNAKVKMINANNEVLINIRRAGNLGRVRIRLKHILLEFLQ